MILCSVPARPSSFTPGQRTADSAETQDGRQILLRNPQVPALRQGALQTRNRVLPTVRHQGPHRPCGGDWSHRAGGSHSEGPVWGKDAYAVSSSAAASRHRYIRYGSSRELEEQEDGEMVVLDVRNKKMQLSLCIHSRFCENLETVSLETVSFKRYGFTNILSETCR